MGANDTAIVWTVTARHTAPDSEEIELTLLGPGYGESIVLNVGEGVWVVVDSCVNSDGRPKALAYLDSILSHRGCEVWSLSPSDEVFRDFLRYVALEMAGEGQAKRRLLALTPNDVAVALWIGLKHPKEDVVILLGSDLPKLGWRRVARSSARPGERASVFKVPHHGSGNAHEPWYGR